MRQNVKAIAGIYLFLLTINSCAWRTVMEFKSPSGKKAIRFLQPRIDESIGLRLQLISDNQSILVYQSPNDAIVYFAHVYWTPDESVAYRTESAKEVPFDDIKGALSRSIATTYHLPATENPIDWCSTMEASAEFFRRYPMQIY